MTTVHGKFSTSTLKGYAQKKRFYLGDGSNLYRILPPFKSLSAAGVIAKYWEVYWLEGSNKGKRPVPSILKTKSNGKGQPKTILHADPLYDKINALRLKVEAMEKTPGSQDDPIVKALKEKLQTLNLDKAYYLNVISPAGEIGVLKIKYTGFQNLKTRLEELEKQGIDAINSGTGNGIVFDFKKFKDDQGKTTYPVDIATKTYKDQATGRFISEMQQFEIDDKILSRMEKEAFDLSTLFQIKTDEEVALLATLDPKMVDRVFARPEEVPAETTDGDDEEAETELVTRSVTPKTSPEVQRSVTPSPAAVAAKQQIEQSAPVTPPVAQAGNNAEMQSIVDRFLSTGTVK